MKQFDVMTNARGLRGALAFLTLLPVGQGADFEPRLVPRWFPVAGLVIGLGLALFDSLACRFFPPLAASVLDVAFLAVLTGGLHLDGLADSADGLYGLHDRDRALAIMKDSRVGAMGLVAVVLCLGIKASALAGVGPYRFLALVLVPAYARAGMLVPMRLLPYAREQGAGKAFFTDEKTLSLFIFLPVPVLASLALGAQALALNLVFFPACLAITGFYKKRLGGVTGDMLGAMVEVLEAVLLLTLCARWPL